LLRGFKVIADGGVDDHGPLSKALHDFTER
jgi:hypothetical protein